MILLVLMFIVAVDIRLSHDEKNLTFFFQIIAFDELKTDYKNPIDQCNSLNPVSYFHLYTSKGDSFVLLLQHNFLRLFEFSSTDFYIIPAFNTL